MSGENLVAFTVENSVKFITMASKKINCSIRTRCKAMQIYHRFKNCIGEPMNYDTKLIAAACINLSVKSNKENINLDDIIMTFCHLLHRPTTQASKCFGDIKKSVHMMECIILRVIEFDLNHHLAHECVMYFLFDIHQELQTLNMWHLIYEQCFKIISDFYLTNKCLEYTSEELAASTIQAAFYLSGIDIETFEFGRLKKWLNRLHPTPNREAILEDIFKVCLISPKAEEQTITF